MHSQKFFNTTVVSFCKWGILSLPLFIAFWVLYTISCHHKGEIINVKKQQDLHCKNSVCNAVASGINGRELSQKKEMDEDEAEVEKERKDALKKAEAEAKKGALKAEAEATVDEKVAEAHKDALAMAEEASEEAAAGADEIPRTVFNDERYQQVCAAVGSMSELCLTIRYPFPAKPRQPEETNIGHGPTDERFFQLSGVIIVDGSYTDQYTASFVSSTDDEIKKCLDDKAREMAQEDGIFGSGEPTAAISVFTRRMARDERFHFFRTKSIEQLQRLRKFFPGPNHFIKTYGDSNVAAGWAACLSEIFPTCTRAPKFHYGSQLYCDLPPKDDARNERNSSQENSNQHYRHRHGRQLGFAPMSLLDRSHDIFISRLGFSGHDPFENFFEDMVEAKDPNRTTSGDLEKVSIIIQHPIAHISRDDDLLNNFNATHRRNTQVLNHSLGLALPLAKAKLAEAGWQVDKVILFDGFPQHFPSETGGWRENIKSCHDDECGNDAGVWNVSEHGKLNCKGPIPRGSAFKRMNDMERYAAIESGYDMRWYGRTWEFSNLFWWQHPGWGSHGLDCTHSDHLSGLYCMYKFFLQAMIDDYYYHGIEETNLKQEKLQKAKSILEAEAAKEGCSGEDTLE